MGLKEAAEAVDTALGQAQSSKECTRLLQDAEQAIKVGP